MVEENILVSGNVKRFLSDRDLLDYEYLYDLFRFKDVVVIDDQILICNRADNWDYYINFPIDIIEDNSSYDFVR